MEIPAWAREHFQKSLSVNTDNCANHKCGLKLYPAMKKLYVNTIQRGCCLLVAHLKWTEAMWENCSVVGDPECCILRTH